MSSCKKINITSTPASRHGGKQRTRIEETKWEYHRLLRSSRHDVTISAVQRIEACSSGFERPENPIEFSQERKRHDAIETSEFSAYHVVVARHDSDEIENGGVSAQFTGIRDRSSSSDLERERERKEIDSRKFGTDAPRDQQLDTEDRGQRSFPLLYKFHRGLGETWEKEVGGSRKGEMRSTTGKFGRRREFLRRGHYLRGGGVRDDADRSEIVLRATIDERWTRYVPVEAG